MTGGLRLAGQTIACPGPGGVKVIIRTRLVDVVSSGSRELREVKPCSGSPLHFGGPLRGPFLSADGLARVLPPDYPTRYRRPIEGSMAEPSSGRADLSRAAHTGKALETSGRP